MDPVAVLEEREMFKRQVRDASLLIVLEDQQRRWESMWGGSGG